MPRARRADPQRGSIDHRLGIAANAGSVADVPVGYAATALVMAM
jgi:hypothetical protein